MSDLPNPPDYWSDNNRMKQLLIEINEFIAVFRRVIKTVYPFDCQECDKDDECRDYDGFDDWKYSSRLNNRSLHSIYLLVDNNYEQPIVCRLLTPFGEIEIFPTQSGAIRQRISQELLKIYRNNVTKIALTCSYTKNNLLSRPCEFLSSTDPTYNRSWAKYILYKLTNNRLPDLIITRQFGNKAPLISRQLVKNLTRGTYKFS